MFLFWLHLGSNALDQRSIRRTILKSSQSVGGHRFPSFEMLDAKIASSLKEIIQNSNVQEKSQSGGAEGPIGGQISLWKTNIAFVISEYSTRESDQLTTVLSSYRQAINSKTVATELPEIENHGEEMHGSADQSPKFLRPEMKSSRQRAPAKGKGKLVSLSKKQGECCQWKAKGQCTKGDDCSFRHD